MILVGEEVAAEVGGDRSFHFFSSTPGGHYTIKLTAPTMDVDLFAHGAGASGGDSDFAAVVDTPTTCAAQLNTPQPTFAAQPPELSAPVLL